MDFITGSTTSSKRSYQPMITQDTTVSTYWFNWRFLLCSLWILLSFTAASLVISKYECPPTTTRSSSNSRQRMPPGIVYDVQLWRPCLRIIHPAWLFMYRVVAFMVLFLMLLLNVAVDGRDIFYYYTQWTFTLVTLYFGLGSIVSMYGCRKYNEDVTDTSEDEDFHDIQHTTITNNNNGASRHTEMPNDAKHFSTIHDINRDDLQIAGFWGYLLQIIFQMIAGAVLLTDIVFWFIIVPFLALKDYNLNLVIISMHSINAIFLFGETALNSLRFPVFRIAYFVLWTSVYVVFQWIVHACVSIWWPYPFLDLSSPLSPLWYTGVAVMHIPCYGVFMLIIKFKHFCLVRFYPQHYHSELY